MYRPALTRLDRAKSSCRSIIGFLAEVGMAGISLIRMSEYLLLFPPTPGVSHARAAHCEDSELEETTTNKSVSNYDESSLTSPNP